MGNAKNSGAGEDLAAVIARHTVETRFDSIPGAAIEAARSSTLDTLGCMVGATGFVPSLRQLADLLREAGGTPESTILGFGGRVPAWTAAFANGAMAHCLDYDDHIPEGHHPSSAVVPAAFALAERIGNVNGRDFLTAVALGQDIFVRLRRNIEWRQDWHLSPVLGVYAAAAACCKLLKLDERETVNALGIAMCQSAGTMELGYGVGSDLRGMYPAFASKGGVFSALMAQRGITGVQSAFEGKAGVIPVYFGGQWNRQSMVDGLGVHYQGADTMYKPWPSCGASHVYLDAVLKLMRDHRLAGSDIRKIVVHVGDFAQRLCEPLAGRRRPATVVDAKFSIPYAMALAVSRGRVTLGDFTEEALGDASVLSTADKVEFVADAQYDWKMHLPGGKVTLLTHSGQSLSAESRPENVRGSLSNPLTWNDLVDKFGECVRHAAKPVPAQVIGEVSGSIRQMEALADVSSIVRLLA